MKAETKQGKVFNISEIEEKLERIEQNERKLEALYTRVYSLEKLRSRDRSCKSESDDGNCQKQQVLI